MEENKVPDNCNNCPYTHNKYFTEHQIIPAQGWRAIYKNMDTKEIIIKPVICFSLVEHTQSKDRFVDGRVTMLEDSSVITTLDCAAEDNTDIVFVGLAGPGESQDDIIAVFDKNIKEAKEYHDSDEYTGEDFGDDD